MSIEAAVTDHLDVEGLEALIDSRFPQIHSGGRSLVIEAADKRGVSVRLLYHERHTRPGGTVSGAAMFMLADFSIYVAIIAATGHVGLDAVTTNLNINFLTRPEARDLVARTRLIRLGRRLVVAEVQIFSDGAPDMVAHATGTYALPPDAR